MKYSLALIYLIFGKDFDLLTSSFLFFLLMCSFKDMVNTHLMSSFDKIMRNTNRAGSKIIVVCGFPIFSLLLSFQKVCPQYATTTFPVQFPGESIRNPISVREINIASFGYRLCISYLELFIVSNKLKNRQIIASVLWVKDRVSYGGVCFH